MNKVFYSLLVVGTLAVAACGGGHGHGNGSANVPKDSVSADGKLSFHGARISPEGAQPFVIIDSLMNGKDSLLNLKLESSIVAGCQKSGCWMTLKNGEKLPVMVSFKDYAFFVPKDCAGKTAVVEGKAFMKEYEVDELVHYATDAGMSEEEAKKKYTKAEKALAFEATGVVVKAN